MKCGGTLVSEDTVITAAHCFERGFEDAGNTHIRLGEDDLGSDDDGVSPVDIEILEVVQHPDWNVTAFKNDIAMVKLSTPVSFTDLIMPACLPDTFQQLDLSIYRILTSPDPVVVGWGSTRKHSGLSSGSKRDAEIGMIFQEECQDIFSRLYSQEFIKFEETQMCGRHRRRDICNSDDGAGLMSINVGDRWTLAGVLSFGGNCDREDPSVFTRVDKYLPWIKDNM